MLKQYILGIKIHIQIQHYFGHQSKRNCRKDNTFLLCLRKWDKKTDESWPKIIEECKDYAKEYSLNLKLLPMDLRDQKELIALKDTSIELLKPKSASDVLKIISKAKILCSMRLHPSILALAVGTPVLSISYSTKVRNFIESLNVKAGAIVLNLNEADKIKNSLNEIAGQTPEFDIETPTKKNQEFLAAVLHQE